MEHEERLLRESLSVQHDPLSRGEYLPGGSPQRQEQAHDGVLAERGQLLHGRGDIRLHCDGE